MPVRLATNAFSLLLAASAGCGGTTTTGDGGADAKGGADAVEAACIDTPFNVSFNGPVICGATECAPGAICVSTLYGRTLMFEPDSGPCPSGTTGSAGDCQPINYECRLMPCACTSLGPCGCQEICTPSGGCLCDWPPKSPFFSCNCTQP